MEQPITPSQPIETTPSIESPPPQNIKRKFRIPKSKLPIILAGIVFAIVLMIGGIFVLGAKNSASNQKGIKTTVILKPTANPIADWKTYTNTSLGYSIEYPKNWYVYSLRDYRYSGYPGVLDPNTAIITSSKKFPKFSAGDGGDIFEGLSIATTSKSMSQILKAAQTPDISGKKPTINKLSISGIDVYQETIPNGTEIPTILYYIVNPSNSTVLVVNLYFSEKTNQTIFVQILSTFEFIQQPPITISSQQKTTTVIPSNTPVPTRTVTAGPTTAPTSTPAPKQGPPTMSITYPTEGQSITMNTSQTFCVVDAPGSNTQGLQKKQNINGSGWTEYKDQYTTCYSPSEGANTLELQYRNPDAESQVYTIHFNFHRE